MMALFLISTLSDMLIRVPFMLLLSFIIQLYAINEQALEQPFADISLVPDKFPI